MVQTSGRRNRLAVGIRCQWFMARVRIIMTGAPGCFSSASNIPIGSGTLCRRLRCRCWSRWLSPLGVRELFT
uniref:Uncharacterized protein n=1 Tax=Arundo donax TaxID=35708 RepID=A0A0A9DQR0_ARUDO